jgi:hypothetical protein
MRAGAGVDGWVVWMGVIMSWLGFSTSLACKP